MTEREYTLDEIDAIVADFLGGIIERTDGREGAAVVGLSGELGAGKTAFVKAVARHLGVAGTVTSPTFVILKIYQIPHTKYNIQHVVHIDAYRLESGDELLHLGFKEMLQDEKNLIFIEWPERVKNILPKDVVNITFEVMGEEKRKIKMSNF